MAGVCSSVAQSRVAPGLAQHPRVRREGTLKLTWVPQRRAYSATLNGQPIGLVRCALPFPFRHVVEIV
jgi:hypothetical protein